MRSGNCCGAVHGDIDGVENRGLMHDGHVNVNIVDVIVRGGKAEF